MKNRLIGYAKDGLAMFFRITGIVESGALVAPLVTPENDDLLEYKLQNIICYF